MTKEQSLLLAFYLIVLVGIGLISIHYRRKYEELKEWIRLKKEIGEL